MDKSLLNKELLEKVPKEVLQDVVNCKELLNHNMNRFCNDFAIEDSALSEGFEDTKKLKGYFERLGGMFYCDINAVIPNMDLADSIYLDKGGTYYSYDKTFDMPRDEDVADIDLFNSCVSTAILCDYYEKANKDFDDIVINLEKQFDVTFPNGIKENTFIDSLSNDVLELKKMLSDSKNNKKKGSLKKSTENFITNDGIADGM